MLDSYQQLRQSERHYEAEMKRLSIQVCGKTYIYTVEPLNKGHFGANSFVPYREVVPISEVK